MAKKILLVDDAAFMRKMIKDPLSKSGYTDLHEAVAKVPVEDEAKKGKIIDVVQKGYKLKDKVVRYAKVVVGE